MSRSVDPRQRLDQPFQIRLSAAKVETYRWAAGLERIDLSAWIRQACDEKAERQRAEQAKPLAPTTSSLVG